MPGVSREMAGIFNYTTKREWRRVLGREIRSEGYDRFNPKPATPPVMPDTDDPITLVAYVQNQNGHRAVVAGTQTTLWRYYGLDDPNYCYDPYSLGDGYYANGSYNLDVDADTKEPGPKYGKYTRGAFTARNVLDVDPLYVEDGYYADDPAAWLEIGSGFSNQGKRWEWLNINGYLVLNNGVDLPVTYRERDEAVTPIYELRDNGIASVGTIAEHNGILMCMDIRQLKEVEDSFFGAVDGRVTRGGTSNPRYAPFTDETAFAVNSGVDGVAGNTLTVPAQNILYDAEHTTLAQLKLKVPDYWAVGDTLVIWDRINNTFAWRTITAVDTVGWTGPGAPLAITLDGDPLLAGGTALAWPSFTGSTFLGPYFFEATLSDETGLAAGNILTLDRERNYSVGQKVILWDGADWLTRALVSQTDATHWVVDGAAVLVDQRSVRWYWAPGSNNNDNPYPSKSPTDINASTVRPSIETLFPELLWALDEDTVTGLHLYFASSESVKITGIRAVGGEHFFITDGMDTVAESTIRIENYAAYGVPAEADIDHFQWRVLWSMPDEPRRFGATVTGTIVPTSNTITLDAPTKSFAVGQSVKVVNTANQLGNITGTIISLTPNQMTLGGSVITTAGQSVVDEVTVARMAKDTAKAVLDSATSALAVAKDVLADATAALDDDPTDPDLIQAKADAAAAVTTLEKKVSDAKTAFDDATKALTEAEKLLKAVPVSIQDAAAAESIIAFEDLISDGSAILRGLTLKNYFIVYKETCIFIGRYTGQVAQPFVFERVEIPESAALKFKHTLVDVGGEFHFFAAADGFYRFDLTNRIPLELPELTVCRELFFAQASLDDEPFTADNSVTREVFICLPNSTDLDATIRYDYLQRTVSTSSLKMTAASMVPKPTDPSNRSLPDLWFTMGGDAGELRRYGKVNGPEVSSGAIKATVAAGVVTASGAIFTINHVGQTLRFSGGRLFAITEYVSPTVVNVLGTGTIVAPGQTFKIINAIWHRAGAAYASVLESGLEAFGAPTAEKMLNNYVPVLASQSSNSVIGVTFLSSVNPSDPQEEISTDVEDPLAGNLISPVIQSNYLADRITVDGVNNPVEITSRLLSVVGVNSKNFNRNP